MSKKVISPKEVLAHKSPTDDEIESLNMSLLDGSRTFDALVLSKELVFLAQKSGWHVNLIVDSINGNFYRSSTFNKPLSQAAQDARRPPPPVDLMDLLQDTVHISTGRARPAKSIKIRTRK